MQRKTTKYTSALTVLSFAVGGLVHPFGTVGAAGKSDISAEISVALIEPHVRDEVIVKFVPGSPVAEQAQARRTAGAVAAEPLSPLAENSQVLNLGRGTSVGQALEALRRNPNVEYAEPNYLLESTAVSNDPAFTNGTLWGMQGESSNPANQFGSQAAEAWTAGHTGSKDVYVVVIDTGVQVAHPDLAANIWTNQFETAGDGIDNDGNGYVDDIHGWDFFSNDATVYDGLDDDHGTHVAGTIGGVGGNGTGVVGVNWDVTMITAKFLGPNGGSTSEAIRAVDYATGLKTRHGLNIVATSNSWGGGGASTALLDAIERGGDAGILFVAAAGNANVDNDTSPHYPSNYVCDRTAAGAVRGWDCVISVASITSSGARSSFSNYGDISVDLGAPGSSIYSTLPSNTYGSYSGTSMATPHVSGAIALCASMNPAQTAAELRLALLDKVAPTSSMNSVTTTGGRLDMSSMLTACVASTEPVSGSPSALSATAIDSSTVNLTWTDQSTAENFHQVEMSSDGCATFTLVATVGAGVTQATAGGLNPSTDHCFRVRSGNGFQGGSYSSWSNTAMARTLDPPPPYTCVSEPYNWVSTATGSALTLTDEATSSQAIGFSFPLYDRTHTSAIVTSNGLLNFGSATNPYVNTLIPDAAEPNGFIAAFWDDLNPGAGGSVRVMRDGSPSPEPGFLSGSRRFIASWEAVPHYNVTGSNASFQVILEEATGDIVLQYQDVLFGSSNFDRGRSATVGIENHAGDFGTQISYNQASLTNATAYRCSLPSDVRITTASLPVATTGASYSATLSASGGNGSNTWNVTGLPAGLTLSGATISGTPTTVSTSTVSITVTSGDGSSDSTNLDLVVGSPVTISTPSLAAGTTNTAYSADLTATGGTGTYTWSITAGSLPAGLTLSGNTISGTPTAAGTANFTVRATDTAGRTSTKNLSITITTPVTVTTASLAAGTTNTGYSASLEATGGTVPYTWSITGSLPDGLTLSGNTITGTPTTAGTTTFTVQATDALSRISTRSLSIVITLPISITSMSLPDASSGSPYSANLEATGGTSPYTWSITAGSLPTGLTLSGNTIAGTPTTAGTTNFTVQATDTAGRTSTKDLSITVTVALNYGATAETSGSGSVSGSYEATHVLDGVGQVITEVQTGGRLRDRYDLLGHTWIIPVAPGTNTLTVVGWWNDAGDADSGANFEWFDGSSWKPIGMIGSSTATTISAVLGVPTVTEVQVRVSDTNRTAPNYQVDRITVDLIVISGDGASPDPSIQTTGLPSASLNAAYSAAIEVVGGTNPMNWQVDSGTLPTGLSLNVSTGLISGTATVVGSSSFTIKVTDADSRSVTSVLYTINVVDTPIATTMSASISLTTSGGRNKNGVAIVTVVNNLGAPVVGAAVTVQFTGQFNDRLSGVTGANGTVTFTTATALRQPTFSACVVSLTAAALTWDGSQACSP